MWYTGVMNSAVEQIKERLTIEDVVGQYVELHRAGKSYKGKSPFTTEKTPSFYVSPDRGMYYCFSTNQGGDMFTFIQAMESVDFKGALRILADKAGVELVKEDPKKRTERERHYAVLEEATQFFFDNGMKSDVVGAYLQKRAVTPETRHAWRIGFALDDWRTLRTHLLSKKYTDADMIAVGLVKKPEGGKEPYDVFRNRIVFPISDTSGRVVGFSGRTLSTSAEEAKYLNSPETEFFKKSEILFGYDKAKQGIRTLDFSLICEGQFDVVLSHQAAYTNTVAVSGTAFTEHHIALLQRISNRAVLAFDADKAGIAAAKRSALPMLAKGMDVKVASLVGGKDPADIVAENPAGLKKMVGSAVHVIEWLLNTVKASAKDDRDFKLAAMREVLPLLRAIPNEIDRDHFVGVFAERTGATKEMAYAELKKIIVAEKPKHAEPAKTTFQPVQKTEARSPYGEHAIRDDFLLYYHTFLTVLRTEEKKTAFRAEVEKIFTNICAWIEKEHGAIVAPTDHDINEYIARRTKDIRRNFEESLRTEHIKVQAELLAYELTRFHRLCIDHVIQNHKRKLADLEAAGKDTDAELIKIHTLQSEKTKIKYTVEQLLQV